MVKYDVVGEGAVPRKDVGRENKFPYGAVGVDVPNEEFCWARNLLKIKTKTKLKKKETSFFLMGNICGVKKNVRVAQELGC